MKIKTSKLLAVLCTLAMMLATFVPMFTLSVTAAEEGVTISFANTNQRVSQDSNSQVWQNGDVTFTNNKASSSTAVGNYSNPVRLYAKSAIVFSAPGNITKIVVEAGSTTYATALKNSVGSEAVVSSSTVTITPSTESSTYTVASLTAQVRVKSLTVYYEASSGGTDPDVPACEHTSTTPETVEATATTDGYTVDICDECGAEVGEKYDIVDALGYEVTFVVPNDATAPTAGAKVENDAVVVTMPDGVMPEGDFLHEYVFAGWAAIQLNAETTDKPALHKAGEKVTLTKDTTFYAVYSYSAEGSGATSSAYQLTDISKITATDVVVITVTTTNGSVYAMSNNKGTGSAPAAVAVTIENGKISSDVDDTIKWNIYNDGGNLTIYPNGTTTTWLYCTATNNGVRVGTNTNKVFTIDAESGYLKHTGTSRYLGVYNAQDWRCYTNTTGNTANQTLGFYVLTQSSTVTYYSFKLTENGCAHNDVEDVPAQEATCTESGYTVGKLCNDCGSYIEGHDIIPATGHQNTTETTVDASCTVDGSITKTCDDCGATLSTTSIPAGHKFVDGVCTECGEELPDYSGRYYIAAIRSSGNYFYMTSDLGTASTKRYQAVDTGLAERPASITAPENGYVFVLVNNYDGTYCIYAEGVEGVEGDNYLGWTSGNSGALVSEDKAGVFKVDLLESGLFNIYFDDRYLSLNGTSGNDYFAFYAGTQRQDLALIPVVETPAEPEIPAGDITCVQLELGTDLSLRYQITVAEGESYESFKMVFTLGEKTVEATTTDGKFKLDGIAPDQMDDTITATLYQGDTVVHTLEYSIKAYLETIVNGAEYSAEAKSLAEAILIYGAAAQKHQNDTNAPVTDKAPNVTDADKPESDLSMEQVADKIEGSSVSFKSVGVRFSHVNKLYVALENDPAYTVTVKVNGNNAEIVDGYVYTNAISPVDFDEVYTFELYVDGTLYQTVEYSVNSYISAKWNDASGLAKALYNYELAFVAYINQ